MAFSTNTGSQSSEINVTPLIDVLLVLLIIFMVLVPVRPRGLESSIPQGKSSNAASLPPVTVQVVRPDLPPVAGTTDIPVQYLVNQHAIPNSELEPTLKSMFAVRSDHTLIVQADRELGYEPVAAVVALGHSAGAAQIALSALPKI